MKILLATGIYPPDIGGTATYAVGLLQALQSKGHEVRVVTYGAISDMREAGSEDVHSISKSGGFILRWFRYARALRKYGKNVDVVIALSSVSVGIPLILAFLWKPKKVLRLGGDFFWERYTDHGGMMGLTEWYQSRWGFWRIMNAVFMEFLLQRFHGIVYTTEFQRQIHEKAYLLPRSAVIENPAPLVMTRVVAHAPHTPFRILCMSRFVGFKNLFALVDAIALLPQARCTFVGSGPLEKKLRAYVTDLRLMDRIEFRPPVHGEEKEEVFAEHDLLLIPSTTDISPNVALEARVAGLPILLTKQTGFSSRQTYGMILGEMKTPEQIVYEVQGVLLQYVDIARIAQIPLLPHGWNEVAHKWDVFLSTNI